MRTAFRALLAFVTLIALLVGLPTVLALGTWAALRDAAPRQTGLTDLLTTPDNGNLFLWALVVVGWLAWAAFALSVLVEIPAQLRGRMPRRLPTLGWSQRLAGGLVGAVLALLPMAGGAMAATGAPAPRLAATAPLAPDFAASADEAAASGPAATAAPSGSTAHLPHYTVRATKPADTLWGIAQRCLGSGERWREIAALNQGRLMDGQGRHFDADRPIHPGWSLILPSDARVPAAEHAARPDTGTATSPSTKPSSHPSTKPTPKPSTTPGVRSGSGSVAAPRMVTVRSGDTLSGIAAREMGSAAYWRQLYDANKGVAAPGGHRLTNPDLITPGMRLTIPTPTPLSHEPPETKESPGATSGGSGGSTSATPPGTPSTAPTGAPHSGGATHPTAHPSAPTPSAEDLRPHEQTQSAGEFAVAAGTSVLGAVLLGAVALRRSRRRQLPPRPPQRRPARSPRPDPKTGTGTGPATEWARRAEPPAGERLGYDPLDYDPLVEEVPQFPSEPLPRRTEPWSESSPEQGPTQGRAEPSPFVTPPALLTPPPSFAPTTPTPSATVQPEPQLQWAAQPEPVQQQAGRDLELLGRALRSMARNVAREGRRLPPLNVVRVTAAHTVELHLTAPAPPVAPFRAAHASTVWWCTADAPGLLGPEAAATVPSPYPALVSLGETADGAVVLVDLEAIRLLHLSGDPREIDRVLRTLALELTFTPLADRVGVHVVGVAEDLASVADDRLVVHPTLEHAVGALQQRDAAVRSALLRVGAATPREARSRGVGGEEWAPEVVLCATAPSGSTPAELGRLLDARPRGSVAVVTAAPRRGAGPVARWTLPTSGQGLVPGLEMEIALQKLDDATYDGWLRLLGANVLPPEERRPAPDRIEPTWPEPSWQPTPWDEPGWSESPLPADPSLDGPLDQLGGYAAPPAYDAPAGYDALGPLPPAPDRFPAPGRAAAEPGRFPDGGQPSAPDRFAGPSDPQAAPGRFPAPGGRPVPDRFPAPGQLTGQSGQSGPFAMPPAAPAGPGRFPARSDDLAAPGRFPAPGGTPAESDSYAGLSGAPVGPGRFPSPADPQADPGRFPASGRHSVPPGGGPVVPGPLGGPGQAGELGAGPTAIPGGGQAASRMSGGRDAVSQLRHTPPPHAAGPAPVAPPAPDPGLGGDLPPQQRRLPGDPWILALLATPPGSASAANPQLRVLGPIELAGAAGPVEPERQATLLEAAARRALGPAQGAYVSADAIGRLREWLGDGPDGRPVNLRCDWDDFQALRARGLKDGGAAGDTALARALALVRGVPFAGAAYPWAEPLRQRITAAVVDVAHELTLRRLRARDHRGAEAAAVRGLVAEPEAELLLRDLVCLYADEANGPQLHRIVARLESKPTRSGVSLEPESAALLDELRTPADHLLSRP